MNTGAFTAILGEGMMVGVKIGPDNPWHANVLYGVDDTTVRIAYAGKFMESGAERGCRAWIKYSNDYFVYYYSGTVTGFIPSVQPEYVTIQIKDAEEIINNRLYPRYDVRLSGLLKPIWDDVTYDCTVTDLSYGGAAFVCTHKFDLSEQLDMSLQLPGNVTFKVTGKIVRSKSSSSNFVNHSIQFFEYSSLNSRQLSRYFSGLDEEAAEIYRQYLETTKSNGYT